jgi:hypothetical protein
MSQRVAAAGAILVAAVVVLATIASAPTDLRLLAVVLPLIVVALAAAWYAITRTVGRRQLAMVVLAATASGFVAVAFIDGARSAVIPVARVLMLVAVVVLARFALGRAFDHSSVRTRPERPFLRSSRRARREPRRGCGRTEQSPWRRRGCVIGLVSVQDADHAQRATAGRERS